MPAKHHGRSLYVAFERNGRQFERAILFAETTGRFLPKFLADRHNFCIENDEEVTKYL